MTAITTPSISQIIQEFLDAMSSGGVTYSGTVIDDGDLHRFRIDDDKPGTLNGWYVFYSDGIPSGAFGSWKTGQSSTWCSKQPNELTVDERRDQQSRMQAAKLKRTNAIKAQHKEAATKALEIWTHTDWTNEHPYLTRKQVRAHGVKVTTREITWKASYADHAQTIPANSLIVPMWGDDRQLKSLQFIYAHKPDIGRDKTFVKGGQKKATYHTIANPKHGDNGVGDVLYICEGYGTGATIHEVTGEATVIAWDTGNLGDVGRVMRQKFPTKQIIFAADNDQWTDTPIKNPGVTKARTAAAQIRGVVVIPKFKDTKGRPTDFNDLCAREGADVVRRQLTPQQPKAADTSAGIDPGSIFPNIPGLSLKADESPHAHLTNAIAILKHDGRWRHKLAFNEFSNDIEAVSDLPVEKGTPGPWTDNYDSKTTAWLADQCNLRLNTKIVSEAVATVARDNPFHPVRDELNALVWDGIDRLNDWVHDFLGVENKSLYSQSVGRCFLIASVARIFDPGCKHDVALILEGGQGKGKSSAVRILGGEHTLDTSFEIGSKDGYSAIQGSWFVELAELDSLSRTATSRIKAFFSSSFDVYRPPYARRAIKVARQCVFIGTVNHSEYLEDETGNRRFWPIECGEIDLEGLANARDQLFAEAVHRYRAGESWWFKDQALNDEATDEQKKRYRGDLWSEMLQNYIAEKGGLFSDEISTYDLLTKALFVEPDKIERKHEMRVGKCMQHIGWSKIRKRTPNGLISAYKKIGT